MIDQLARVTAVVRDHLKKIAMGEPFGYMVVYAYAPVKMPDGTQQLAPAFVVTVTLKGSLIGRPDYAFPAIIPSLGYMPPDVAFTQSAEGALEMARQLRAQDMSVSGLGVVEGK